MSPKPDESQKSTTSRGSFYERGTPEEEEAKHMERVKRAKELKEKRTGKPNAG